MQHNVTLQAFAHAACLVSQLPSVAFQALQAMHRPHSLLQLLSGHMIQYLMDTLRCGALIRCWHMHLHVKTEVCPVLYKLISLLAVMHRL